MTGRLARELRALAEAATAAWALHDVETLLELTKDVERIAPEAADALQEAEAMRPYALRCGWGADEEWLSEC